MVGKKRAHEAKRSAAPPVKPYPKIQRDSNHRKLDSFKSFSSTALLHFFFFQSHLLLANLLSVRSYQVIRYSFSSEFLFAYRVHLPRDTTEFRISATPWHGSR